MAKSEGVRTDELTVLRNVANLAAGMAYLAVWASQKKRPEDTTPKRERARLASLQFSDLTAALIELNEIRKGSFL